MTPPDDYEAELAGFAVPSGPDPDHGRDELERLASALAERMRAGASPPDPVADERDPLASRLRELTPAIEALERWKVLKEAEFGGGDLPDRLSIDRLGDCRLLRELGRGGNAIVFEAVQGEPPLRRVAVKVFPRRSAQESAARRRFLDEAATMARLRHPHIVPVYAVAEDAGLPFYVMRLAERGSLDRVIARLRKPTGDFAGTTSFAGGGAVTGELQRGDWRAFAGLAIQVAQGLAHAHASGVIHGDVKPANVLLDADGAALVTDFGPSPRPEPGGRGRLAGTYRYMAPERFAGHCDERSDVYSLGATLYELVSLAPAFEESDQETLIRSVIRHELIAPRLIRPEIPTDLDAIILKAMSRDPDGRYVTVSELAADLLDFLRGRRVAARRRRPMTDWLRAFRSESGGP